MVAAGRLVATVIFGWIQLRERVLGVALLIGVVAVVGTAIAHIVLRSLSIAARPFRVRSSSRLLNLEIF